MPNLSRIFIANLCLFFLLCIQTVVAQSNSENLYAADSLFETKQYKEALTLYEALLFEGEAYSPAMLLKMGFISEGIGEYGKAALYLSKYYDHNPNPRVTDKIKTLTNQGTLQGYEISDRDRFLKVLIDLKVEITTVLSLLLIIFLILVFLVPKKRSVFYYPAAFCLVLALISNNFLNAPETAIITGGPVLIMDQPSSAGNLVRRVEAGHRVIIESSEDIWYEITWGNTRAYIKKGDVSKI